MATVKDPRWQPTTKNCIVLRIVCRRGVLYHYVSHATSSDTVSDTVLSLVTDSALQSSDYKDQGTNLLHQWSIRHQARARCRQ
jgi:hypothetical protein